jgi:hypothetical protein
LGLMYVFLWHYLINYILSFPDPFLQQVLYFFLKFSFSVLDFLFLLFLFGRLCFNPLINCFFLFLSYFDHSLYLFFLQVFFCPKYYDFTFTSLVIIFLFVIFFLACDSCLYTFCFRSSRLLTVSEFELDLNH